MAYSVYENRNKDKAVVHRSDCPSYKVHGGADNDKRFWHDGYTTPDEAMKAAKATGRKDVRFCKYCAAPRL